jgi:hypothetical protein
VPMPTWLWFPCAFGWIFFLSNIIGQFWSISEWLVPVYFLSAVLKNSNYTGSALVSFSMTGNGPVKAQEALLFWDSAFFLSRYWCWYSYCFLLISFPLFVEHLSSTNPLLQVPFFPRPPGLIYILRTWTCIGNQ